MRAFGVKPDQAMWERINLAFLDGRREQNAAVTTVTLLSGATAIIKHSLGMSEDEARAHIAAILLSPDTGPPGWLLPKLEAELRKLGWEKPS